MQLERSLHPEALWTKNVTAQSEKNTGSVLLLMIVSVASAFSVERNRVRSKTREAEMLRSGGPAPENAKALSRQSVAIESVFTQYMHRIIAYLCDQVYGTNCLLWRLWVNVSVVPSVVTITAPISSVR